MTTLERLCEQKKHAEEQGLLVPNKASVMNSARLLRTTKALIVAVEALESISGINSNRFKINYPEKCCRGDLINIIDTDTAVAKEAVEKIKTLIGGGE